MTPIEKLADDHWQWTKGLIESLEGDPHINIKTLEYIYKTAMIHGYKHGVADERQFKCDTRT
jgi:hypothetical protein